MKNVLGRNVVSILLLSHPATLPILCAYALTVCTVKGLDIRL